MSTNVQTIVNPTVNVTTNKNRIKRYNSESNQPIYYLKPKQEFELEIFNPTTFIVKAVISLNGKRISNSGLVIKPGERVFLDRYLDEPKKFKFETYNVSGTSSEVKAAIANNGIVKVEFYSEYNDLSRWINVQPTYTYYNNTGTQTIPYYGTTSISNSGGILTTSTCTTDVLNYGSFQTTSFNSPKELLCDSPAPEYKSTVRKTKSIETGMVGKGSTSNQEFTNVNMAFNTWAFHTVESKILPVSQKQITSDDLNVVQYCTECGSKLKPTYKFCSNCGTKR